MIRVLAHAFTKGNRPASSAPIGKPDQTKARMVERRFPVAAQSTVTRARGSGLEDR